MSERDTVEVIAEELALALQPLTAALSSPAALRDFLEELGWDFPAPPAALNSLQAPAEQAFALATRGDGVGDADLTALLSGVRAAFGAIADLQSAAGVTDEFRNEFPRQLLDYLLVEYLLQQQPRWGYLVRALGIIRLEPVAAAGGRPAYVRRVFAFEDLGSLLGDPLGFLAGVYRWGQSDFAGDRLVTSLAGMLDGWELPAREELLDPQTAAQLKSGALDPDEVSDRTLRLYLIETRNADDAFGAGVGLFLLPDTAAAKPGFALLPFAAGEFEEAVPITDSLQLVFGGSVALTGGVGVFLRPGRDPELLVGLGPGTPSAASGTFAIGLRLAEPGGPVVLLGDPGASRLEARGVSVSGGTRFHSGGKHEAFTELAFEGGKIVIQAGEGDGFLAQLLPAEGMAIEIDLSVGFSTTQGLYFGGSGGLEVSLPTHIQLGPIEIQSALLAVKVKDGAIPVELAATVRGDLAVLQAVVENVGVRAVFTFPADRKGNLGPANLAFELRPPNGVGLSIDAGVVKGGGYLFFDSEKGEYAGALELTISNFLSLKAIGLINTKLPGGRPGFSLLVIITAEFDPGFQLGYGFTLLGVGGMLGVNRRALLELLAAGVRTGAVNNVLFPTNVVANAPRILSDLRTIFPPHEGTFLIGPMAKIAWGTPTLISISLGVIIEIPGNVVILGRLRVALPTDEAAVLVLQVTFIGALEFDKRRVWFFASMFESRVLFITLDGEMGLLVDYGDNPSFLVSIGGFHPRFTAPPLPFPSPNRVALSLINESWARVRVELYFALTSNSVQMGVRAEAFFGFDALSVTGYFSFDALLRFSPLYLIVEISAGFSVKVFGVGLFGVHLRGSLEGPTPWHIQGAARISLLFFSISVDVDVTFGERRVDTLPPIEVLPRLLAELGKLESWRATPPASGQLFVSLRELDAAGALVLHPVGTLQISQRFVPLNLPLDKVGNQKPSDIRKASVSVTGSLAVRGAMREKFAAAQFREMDDAAKLSAPAFEPLESGVELGAAGRPWKTGRGAQRTVRYETIVVDTAFERFRIRFFEFWGGLFTHFRAGATVSKVELSQAHAKRLQPFEAKVVVEADRFTVARQADNRAYAAAATFASYAEAQAHLQQAVRADPSLAESMHVIPSAEVNAAA